MQITHTKQTSRRLHAQTHWIRLLTIISRHGRSMVRYNDINPLCGEKHDLKDPHAGQKGKCRPSTVYHATCE